MPMLALHKGGPVGRRPGLPRGGLLILLCLLVPGGLLAAPATGAATRPRDPEFAPAPLGRRTPNPLPPLEYSLEAGASLLALLEDDAEAIYGGLAVAQLRLGVWPSERLVYHLGFGYGRAQGDPWYEEPTFSDGAQAELLVVPLTMGLRWDLAPRPDFRLNLGCNFDLAWVRETMPGGNGLDIDEPLRESGWLRGYGVSFGPEWPLGGGRHSFGFETGMTGSGGTVGGRYGRDSSLSGVWGRVFATIRI